MRDRATIEKQARQPFINGRDKKGLILEVLLDIRDLLLTRKEGRT